VNGQVLEITLAEAVLISPKVHEALRLDRNSRTFTISDDTIDSKSSGIFLNLFALVTVLPCQRTKSYHFDQFVDFWEMNDLRLSWLHQ
jgi:hypothetical protein